MMMINEDDWFPNPLDSMPIATDKGYITDEYAPCDVEYDLENPDESDEIEASKEPDSMHEVMYQIAIKNGGSWIGGSENASRL
tara:strand:- start:52 stop:300 length:249 start_codon:yes stop_codon:yes gene_type:complete